MCIYAYVYVEAMLLLVLVSVLCGSVITGTRNWARRRTDRRTNAVLAVRMAALAGDPVLEQICNEAARLQQGARAIPLVEGLSTKQKIHLTLRNAR